MAPEARPYGSWPSPITAELLVSDVVRLAQPWVDGGHVYWIEGRPQEKGRQVVVRDGEDVIGPGMAARTLVHEYGGASYAVRDGVVWFANFEDQRIYRDGDPITADDGGLTRYADFDVSPDGRWLAAVREQHGDEVVNDIVLVPADGRGDVLVQASGYDFFSAPRWSPDGSRLAWLSWEHPNMPWDETTLWAAAVGGAASEVARGASISQPRWSPSGVLHYASDSTGWWNLYDESGRAVCPMDAEFSGPDWVFGQSSYVFLPDGRIVCVWFDGEADHLGVVDDDGRLVEVPQPYTSIASVVAYDDDSVVALAASASLPRAVVRFRVPGGGVEVLRASQEVTVDRSFLSVPKRIEFPTPDGAVSYALFYPPASGACVGPEGELPPLVVMSHGGPTGRTESAFNLGLQYFTSRGFAVADVNYGGSTGFGRAYRERLKGKWGIVDVDDCVAAVQWLSSEGLVDGRRATIRGGSAGGYTTLAALTFRPGVFAAGASHFGVGDLETLARDTHKFESRYLDGLVGPYPAAREVYVERSPAHHTDRLSTPMILFQGLEDKVVPPSQAEEMVAALRANGVPFAYLAFEGEQHGFRQASTIVRVAEAELQFYGRVLGFVPAGVDAMEPLEIENLAG